MALPSGRNRREVHSGLGCRLRYRRNGSVFSIRIAERIIFVSVTRNRRRPRLRTGRFSRKMAWFFRFAETSVLELFSRRKRSSTPLFGIENKADIVKNCNEPGKIVKGCNGLRIQPRKQIYLSCVPIEGKFFYVAIHLRGPAAFRGSCRRRCTEWPCSLRRTTNPRCHSNS